MRDMKGCLLHFCCSFLMSFMYLLSKSDKTL